MTTTQSVITILAVVLGTMVTRFVPFIIFRRVEAAGVYYISGNCASFRSHWPAGCLLPERCVWRFIPRAS